MVNREESNLDCTLCDFRTTSEEALNEHIMEQHDNIILKKEADASYRENLECLVEIKQEVEDPLTVDDDDDDDNLKMEAEESSSSTTVPLKAEYSEEGNNSRSRKPASEQVLRLKRARQSRPRAAKNLAVQTTRMLLEDLETAPLKRLLKAPAAKPAKPVKPVKPARQVAKSAKKFSCDHCSFKATGRPGLQRHVKSVHLKDLKFLCTACGKRFADQADLSRHVDKNNITTSDGVWQMACSKFRKVPSDAADYLAHDDAAGELRCVKCGFSSAD